MSGINIASVQFNRAGKLFDFQYIDLELRVGDQVIVETERGLSLAQVMRLGFKALQTSKESGQRRLKPIVRKAQTRDLEMSERLEEDYVTSYTHSMVSELKLEMNILKSDVQFGGSKVVVYFSAPSRVDFRDLVKRLASGLKTRIELKQIGARDETKLLGGLGICGREYCCSSFLREFVPVSIRMAKNQNLALNPGKMSGGCGRLLCCLTYENDTYTELRQNLPPRGATVLVGPHKESAKVLRSDLLNQTVQVELMSGQTEMFAIKDIEIPKAAKGKKAEPLSSMDSVGEWGDDLDFGSLVRHLRKSSKK